MKVNREEFLNKLDAVRGGLAVRETVEQSSCFVFTGDRIATFNDEVAASVDFKTDFSGAVAAKPLTDILRKLPEETVDLSEAADGLVVSGKGRRATVRREAEILLPVAAEMVFHGILGQFAKRPGQFAIRGQIGYRDPRPGAGAEQRRIQTPAEASQPHDQNGSALEEADVHIQPRYGRPPVSAGPWRSGSWR